jgi:hypothetical protein
MPALGWPDRMRFYKISCPGGAKRICLFHLRQGPRDALIAARRHTDKPFIIIRLCTQHTGNAFAEPARALDIVCAVSTCASARSSIHRD